MKYSCLAGTTQTVQRHRKEKITWELNSHEYSFPEWTVQAGI
ncbi:MAG TPA: hypothetical protein VD905_09585 [Flavobacteriales bacterium]|nr:hypothetical protein [Flavobacteriales bacterium]